MTAVRVVAVWDVACTTSEAVAFALLALEFKNDFLLKVKHTKQNVIKEINKEQQVIQLANNDRIRECLRKMVGKLNSRIGRAEGGEERKKIKTGKSHVIVQSDDLIDVSSVKEKLKETHYVHNRSNINQSHCT